MCASIQFKGNYRRKGSAGLKSMFISVNLKWSKVVCVCVCVHACVCVEGVA